MCIFEILSLFSFFPFITCGMSMSMSSLKFADDDGGGSDDSDKKDIVKYSVKGKEYTEEELHGFISSGLRQSDYTAKTQQLAEERRQLQKEKESLASIKNRDNGGDEGNISSRLEKIETLLNVGLIDKEDLDLRSSEKYGKFYADHDVDIAKFAVENDIPTLTAATKLYIAENFDKFFETHAKEKENKMKKDLEKKADKTMETHGSSGSKESSGFVYDRTQSASKNHARFLAMKNKN